MEINIAGVNKRSDKNEKMDYSIQRKEILNRRKENLLRCAARCRHNGNYEMCAMWLSKYKQLKAKYGN